jgi:hypothetical protein
MCGDSFSDKRKKLGYGTCLSCGAEEASYETDAKKKCVAISYNKGPYQFITSRSMVRDLGKK